MHNSEACSYWWRNSNGEQVDPSLDATMYFETKEKGVQHGLGLSFFGGDEWGTKPAKGLNKKGDFVFPQHLTSICF